MYIYINLYTDLYIYVYINVHIYISIHLNKCTHIHFHTYFFWTHVINFLYVVIDPYANTIVQGSYEVATISRLLKFICLFCKRDL